eukprot:756615-Hanusia_phi.AAC.2
MPPSLLATPDHSPSRSPTLPCSLFSPVQGGGTHYTSWSRDPQLTYNRRASARAFSRLPAHPPQTEAEGPAPPSPAIPPHLAESSKPGVDLLIRPTGANLQRRLHDLRADWAARSIRIHEVPHVPQPLLRQRQPKFLRLGRHRRLELLVLMGRRHSHQRVRLGDWRRKLLPLARGGERAAGAGGSCG